MSARYGRMSSGASVCERENPIVLEAQPCRDAGLLGMEKKTLPPGQAQLQGLRSCISCPGPYLSHKDVPCHAQGLSGSGAHRDLKDPGDLGKDKATTFTKAPGTLPKAGQCSGFPHRGDLRKHPQTRQQHQPWSLAFSGGRARKGRFVSILLAGQITPN